MSYRRIVVVLDTLSPAAVTATAIELARSIEAELVGLFVEDIELINLAALPFGEVSFPSAIRRNLDVNAMERSLRAQARRVHQQLGARLAGDQIKWTFEVVRGRIVPALTAHAVAQDIVVVPVSRAVAGKGRARARSARAFDLLRVPLLLVSESVHSDGPIVIVPPHRATVQEIAEVVVALAPYYGRSALFLLVESEEARWESWRRDMQALLAEYAILVRFRVVADGTRAEVERVIAEEQPRIVVAIAPTTASRDELLDTLPCPLLVLPGHEASTVGDS